MKLPKSIQPIQRTQSTHAANDRQVVPQGCNPFTCGAKVLACGAACASGVGTIACIACLGSAYDSCKDCF